PGALRNAPIFIGTSDGIQKIYEEINNLLVIGHNREAIEMATYFTARQCGISEKTSRRYMKYLESHLI
ncbi:MAG: hypothetical protein AAFP89_22720, partial [Bacteroidota bacterium]